MKQYLFFLCILLFSSCAPLTQTKRGCPSVAFYYSPTRDKQLREQALLENKPYIVCLINGVQYTSLNDPCGSTDAVLVAKIPVRDAHVLYKVVVQNKEVQNALYTF
jgi:hypothetical protein